MRCKQYRMQIGGLKFSIRPDNTHAKFKTILSSFPNLLTCSFLIQHQQLQPAGINKTLSYYNQPNNFVILIVFKRRSWKHFNLTM